jgi:phosphate starvation-inducible PhoH-like protein
MPFLLPLLDHFEYFLGDVETDSLIQRGTIEIAPLNYMRGRTFNNSFMILDEAQNATYEEIKMFLTRIGFKSKAILNGDTTQSDLPYEDAHDFGKVIKKLDNTDFIGICSLGPQDIVRNPIISKILAKLQ